MLDIFSADIYCITRTNEMFRKMCRIFRRDFACCLKSLQQLANPTSVDHRRQKNKIGWIVCGWSCALFPAVGYCGLRLKAPPAFGTTGAIKFTVLVVRGSSFLSYSLFVLQDSFLFSTSCDLQSVFFPKFLYSSPKLEYGYLYGGIKKDHTHKNPPPGLGK